jgi:hypothetical protein
MIQLCDMCINNKYYSHEYCTARLKLKCGSYCANCAKTIKVGSYVYIYTFEFSFGAQPVNNINIQQEELFDGNTLDTFVLVTDINDLEIGTCVTYFNVNPLTGKRRLNSNGLARLMQPAYDYRITLSNKYLTWHINPHGVQFVKKLQ